ncbi:MAG: hypothetical protein K0S39_611 [Paenibacillus sp.]|nr:hypothetical protein [Paenibacillus sp.]
MYKLRTEIEANTIELILPSLTKRYFGQLYDSAQRMKTNGLVQDYSAISANRFGESRWKIVEWGKLKAITYPA